MVYLLFPSRSFLPILDSRMLPLCLLLQLVYALSLLICFASSVIKSSPHSLDIICNTMSCLVLLQSCVLLDISFTYSFNIQ